MSLPNTSEKNERRSENEDIDGFNYFGIIKLERSNPAFTDVQLPENLPGISHDFRALVSAYNEDDISILLQNMMNIKSGFNNLKEIKNASGLNLNIHLPRIVVVGDESSGKSSVLSRLCHLDIFPRDATMCTKMPIELHLQNKTEKELRKLKLVHVKIEGEKWLNSNDITTLRASITKAMDTIVAEEHNGLVGITNKPLVIRVVSPQVPTLTLIDLPGLRAARQKNEVEGLQKKIDDLVTSYITPNDTIIVAVVSAIANMTTNRIFDLVTKAGKINETLGVLTRVDRFPYDFELSNILNKNAPDYIPLGMGYIAVYNPDRLDKQSLSEWCDKEINFFKVKHPDLVSKNVVGIDCLSQKSTLVECQDILVNYKNTLGRVPLENSEELFWNEMKAYITSTLIGGLFEIDNLKIQEVIAERARVCFQSLTFPPASQANFVNERMEYLKLKLNIEKYLIVYSHQINFEIISLIKNMIVSDSVSTFNLFRFQNFHEAIEQHLNREFAFHVKALINDLTNSIRPTFSISDLFNRFSTEALKAKNDPNFKPDVMVLTIDNLLIPLEGIINGIAFKKDYLCEGEKYIQIRKTILETSNSITIANEKLLQL
ncbi:hypothetical protein HDU92_007144 [Lobulomyces angularis]|nr:hypothetical protein HDU92_007144 [Lobulomyces angularis]